MVLSHVVLLLDLLPFWDELAGIGEKGVKEILEGESGFFAGYAQLEEDLMASHFVALRLEMEGQVIEEVEDFR